MKSYAVIDIGTLKVKTEIASLHDSGILNRIYHSNNLTCFGVGMDENNGNIQEKYLDATINELNRIKSVLEEYKVNHYKVVSTHALRRAKNREYVLDRMQKESGFLIENISQEQEAELFFNAVMKTFTNSSQEYAVVDVGGGSVQILIGKPGNLRKSVMMQTGTVTLAERVEKNPHSELGYTTSRDIEQMKQLILDHLIEIEATENVPVIYGSSMIIDVMQKIGMYLEPHTESNSHPYKTYATHLNTFINKILPLNMGEREKLYDLPHGFMWGIDKGFLNVVTIGEYLKSPYIIPSNANIAQGIIYSMAEE
jgi:exopolyphosphatase/guanosine-5'-triphosphate,3'-diphosphate pyrophosphatase